MMSRLFLLAMLLHGALADISPLIKGIGVVQAADLDACVTAVSVVNECLAQPSFAQQPRASQASCLCCIGRANIASEYGSCATYISTTAPSQTVLYTDNVVLEEVCSSSTSICSAAPATTTRSTSITTSSYTTIVTREPPACSSLNSIIFSCSRAVTSFLDLPNRQQASCLCYNAAGSSTSGFERYASTCASFYRTAIPTDYSYITPLTTFCARYGSATGGFVAPTATPTNQPGSPSGRPTTTTSPTGTTTVTAQAATSTTPSGGQAPRAAAPGLLALAVGLLALLPSFVAFV